MGVVGAIVGFSRRVLRKIRRGSGPAKKSRGPHSTRAVGRRHVRAGGWMVYDAAETNDDNRRHWAKADGGSAVWANNANVRRTLRNRSRYERFNNGYYGGAIDTVANDIVGATGPKIQITSGNDDNDAFVEREFGAWMKATGLRQKLRTFVGSKKTDGEGVVILTTNPKLGTPVKLDAKPIEPEQLSTPLTAYGVRGAVADRFGSLAEWMTDGILFDEFGNPIEYHVLKNHPGDGNADPFAFDRLGPESVIHWFTATRPGQCRGVPDGVASIPLCAQLRRFTKASLAAAEIQADLAGVLETEAPSEADEVDEIPSLELEQGIIPTLPGGYKLKPFDPTHPTATYPQFKREILSEIGRPLGLPYTKTACDSSGANYSSTRFDAQESQDDVAIERTDVEDVALDKFFAAWLAEAELIPGYLPADFDSSTISHEWYWSGFGFIDPVKEATAIQIKLENNLTTLKAEHAKNGDDWRKVIDQRAIEIDYCRAKGVPLALAMPASTSADHPANRPEPEPETRPEKTAARSRLNLEELACR